MITATVTAQRGLHLRTQADAKSDSLGVLSKDDALLVLQVSINGKWVRVQVQRSKTDLLGKRGWVYSDYVTIHTAPPDVPGPGRIEPTEERRDWTWPVLAVIGALTVAVIAIRWLA